MRFLNFLFAVRIKVIFYKFQLSTNYEKIILKFVILSIALPKLGNILPVGSEITCIKKGLRMYNFRINSRMYNSSIDISLWFYLIKQKFKEMKLSAKGN